jgi:C-terminal processing protease CtpA/Prc
MVTARRKTNLLCDFSGGAADKNGTLKVGDEILSVNSVDVTRMTRLEAWNFMKKLNDGNQVVTVRQKLQQQQQQQVVTVVVTGSNSNSSSVPLVKTELVAEATTTSCRAEKTH